MDHVLNTALRIYCKVILNRFAAFAIFSSVLVYWYFGIIGVANIETRLDAVKILPKDSPIQKTNHILSNIGERGAGVRQLSKGNFPTLGTPESSCFR